MADKNLKIDIITPQSVVFSGDAISVNVPGALSPFEVLYNHAAIVSSLNNGITKIKLPDSKEIFFATNGGFVEVKQNVVSILVEQAIDLSEINSDEILANIEKIKNDIHNSKSDSEKILLKSRLGYEQVKMKASTIANKN